MGKQTNLPKNVPVGTKVEKTVKVKGKKRRLTFEKTRSHGKNRNLNWKIKSNKPA